MAKQKLKMPKRLAGMKLPKSVRRTGKGFLKHLRKQGGLELVAEGLIAAGTALMASRKARNTVAEAGQGVGQGLKQGGSDLPEALGAEKPKKDKKLRDKPYSIGESDQRRH